MGFRLYSPDFQSRAGQRCNVAIDDNSTIAASHRLVLTQKSHIASISPYQWSNPNETMDPVSLLIASTPMPHSLRSLGFDTHYFGDVRLIATDMDGTLTIAGKFTAMLLEVFAQLSAANIPVWIVTGRSAGWVSGLVHYLPVAGAIAENGGIFYPAQADGAPIWLVPITDIASHRQQLAQMFQRLQEEFPSLQESTDNRFRLTDWTFDVHGLSATDLDTLNQRCQEWGWDFTYSTVQCHIKRSDQNKAAGLQRVMAQYFPDCQPHQVVTVGDSPNDESLFDASRFPLSVGVANVMDYRDRLTHYPSYITTQPEGNGFCELTEFLLTHQLIDANNPEH